jgi:hypothetical protein
MWQRIQMLVPDLSAGSLRHALYELWERNRYGTAAVRMITDHPLVGVGVGGFHVQVPDAAYLNGYTGLPSDNAQNWFRHQLAELGILGSAGLLAFSGMFLWLLLRRRPPAAETTMAAATKGGLLGIGVASLLGMPAQNPVVFVTFVAFVFWWVRLTDAAEPPVADATGGRGRRLFAAAGVVLACFIVGTAYEAWTSLRPPFRALRADWPYRRGFHDPGPGGSFRWTERTAVDVFPIGDAREDRWLRLSLGAVAPDADRRPVEVKVWRDHDLILRLTRRSDTLKSWYVRVPAGRKMMMLEIAVSRAWRPSDGADQRERGVTVDQWRFSFDAPKGEFQVPWPTPRDVAR